MSIILDALKKAQKERKKTAPGVPFNLPGPKKKSRFLVYGILLVCVLVVLGYLFVPAFQSPKQTKVAIIPPASPKQQVAKIETPSQKPDAEAVKKEQAPVKQAPLRVTEAAPEEKKVSVAAPRKTVAGDRKKIKDIPAKTMPVKMAASARPAEKTGELKEDGKVVTRATDNEKANLLYNEAAAALQTGHSGEAKRIYRAVLAIKPDHVEALNNLGVIAVQEGNSKEALFYFKKILDLQKNYPKAYNNIGLLMMSEGDAGLAEEYFRKAIVMEPDSIEPYLNLSALLRRNGRLDEASRLLNVPIGKKVRNPALFLSYAIIQDTMGKTEDAVRYYRQYLSTVKSPEARKEVIERLRFLEENRNPERR
ncbi:MAG: Lipoprotein NlpI precursor [Syntrophorhabdus sp. PtaU1.Bin058]|nr:MAG: Lipoprotein NlpI precursor [Syntrophorhabdus sp. PtaU1.Bin058]